MYFFCLDSSQNKLHNANKFGVVFVDYKPVIVGSHKKSQASSLSSNKVLWPWTSQLWYAALVSRGYSVNTNFYFHDVGV